MEWQPIETAPKDGYEEDWLMDAILAGLLLLGGVCVAVLVAVVIDAALQAFLG